MSIRDLYLKLLTYKSAMKLNDPLDEKILMEFAYENDLKLPPELKELLLCFNGGEIFVPGTRIYGVKTTKDADSLKMNNRKELRNNFKIPPQYIIFAKLNFGDFMCINLNSPFDIIQWDHEQDESYCTWDSLSDWLADEIDNYESV